MLRANNRPILAYFDAIKHLRLRQLTLILKTGYEPNLLLNARGQNGLQYLISHFGATDAHFRLQAPINKATYLSIAKLLLDSGLDPNTIDLLSGETVIFDAIRFNDKDMVSLLLNYSDFSVRNKSGESALMCAARFGSKQVMRMVLEHLRQLDMDGYFLRQRNRFGLTALELARVENPICAKVIAKHLIAYVPHTAPVLTRSSSHHQLLAPRFHMRPHNAMAFGSRAQASAALLATEDSESDLEAAELGALSGRQTGYKVHAHSGFHDPKAAEFNQYLLEQQEFGGINEQQAGPACSSDDEDFFGGHALAPQAGALTRSRSCMLGPASKQKFASNSGKKQGAKEEANNNNNSKTACSSSWESSGRNAMA